jgi:hypothetical protein
MQQITVDDRVYEAVSTEAARLNQNIDTYVSTVLMREIGLAAKQEPRSETRIWNRAVSRPSGFVR